MKISTSAPTVKLVQKTLFVRILREVIPVSATPVFKGIFVWILTSVPLQILVMQVLLALIVKEVSNANVSQDIMVMAKLAFWVTATIDHVRQIPNAFPLQPSNVSAKKDSKVPEETRSSVSISTSANFAMKTPYAKTK